MIHKTKHAAKLQKIIYINKLNYKIMKTISFKDLEKLQFKLEKLQEQADVIQRFVERKIGCDLNEANEMTNYENPLFHELLAIQGSIEGAIENIYNA